MSTAMTQTQYTQGSGVIVIVPRLLPHLAKRSTTCTMRTLSRNLELGLLVYIKSKSGRVFVSSRLQDFKLINNCFWLSTLARRISIVRQAASALFDQARAIEPNVNLLSRLSQKAGALSFQVNQVPNVNPLFLFINPSSENLNLVLHISLPIVCPVSGCSLSSHG
jgi:hypothetical protein